MPTIEVKNFTKQKAHRLAGQLVWFREVNGGSEKLGRVVGYYYEMAQLVMEMTTRPMTSVDPLLHYYTLVANFRPGSVYYTLVDVFQIDGSRATKSARYPHECLSCGQDAFILFRTIECSNYSCKHYRP